LVVKEIRAVDGQLDMAAMDVKVEGIKNAHLDSIRYAEVFLKDQILPGYGTV
jgi:hypothetical protein